MKTEITQTAGKKRRNGLKAAGLLLFLGGALGIVHYSPVSEYLTPARLRALLDGVGVWAPVLYILGYALGVCLLVPGTLLAALGAAIFGPWWGFLYVWVGAMLGAAGGFLIGRYLGRDYAAALIGPRLRKYDESIRHNGFATVLYLRLLYFPFSPMNFGMGLTGVAFADYLLGTGLGILVGTFIFTFFIGNLGQVWAGGDWSRLNGWQTWLSLALLIGSLFLPKIIRKYRGEEQIAKLRREAKS
jgi:uncharacterized membrane protein YdjX (TVP38/TMEM64 family)